MLTINDDAVLSQIFDPEAGPSSNVQIDVSLPEDPVIRDREVLAEIRNKEKGIILQVEAAQGAPTAEHEAVLQKAKAELEELLVQYPSSASLLNDYAQITRLCYGDQMLVSASVDKAVINQTLSSLGQAISLLTPTSPQAALSPTQSRTLAQAHTQRGALFYPASKAMTNTPNLKCTHPLLRGWTAIEFAEAASRDFWIGGRYGNDIAKALAVHTNPTAKLCGQMVQDAMRREFAPTT